MDTTQKIIRESKVDLPSIEKNLQNLLEEKHYRPRADLESLKKFSKDFLTQKIHPRMLGLSGLRGTGKTTLLWQTAQNISKNGYAGAIYFFHVERLQQLGISLFAISEAIRKMPEMDNQAVFLFDEVHADPNWSKSLKILYDSTNAFILCTGSSALLLQTTADLATRMHTLHTFPLQFTEYISISENLQLQDETGLKKRLKSALFFSKDIKEAQAGLHALSPEIARFYEKLPKARALMVKYIKYHNITRFTKIANEEVILREIEQLFKRVIIEDIPKLIRRNYTYKHSEKLLLRLAASDELNLQTLSQVLGISSEEINETLDILENAELLNILLPYGGYDSKINKNKKAFFMSPSVRLAIISQVTERDDYISKLYEDIVVMYLRRFFNNAILSFASRKKGKNPDFVIETLPKQIVVEVGTNKKSLKQLTDNTIKKRYGILINADAESPSYEKDVIILPLRWFLLL